MSLSRPTHTIPDGPLRADFIHIIESLARLQSTDRVKSVFGTESHGFRLNPPQSESGVADFETKHGIRLPADYRGFIAHVGNGGAGPFYGLFPLGEMDDGVEMRRWQPGDGFVGALDRPFPHAEPWNDLTGRPDLDNVDNPGLDDALDAWEANHYFNPRHVEGAIPICHCGCALRQWLVIAGPEAGNVWNDHRADYRGLSPVQNGLLQRVSFLQWYLEWLNRVLAE